MPDEETTNEANSNNLTAEEREYVKKVVAVHTYNSNLVDKRWGTIGGSLASLIVLISFNVGMHSAVRGGVAIAASIGLGTIVWVLYIQKDRSDAILDVFEEIQLTVATKQRKIYACATGKKGVLKKNEPLETKLKIFMFCWFTALLIFLIVSIFIWDTTPFTV